MPRNEVVVIICALTVTREQEVLYVHYLFFITREQEVLYVHYLFFITRAQEGAAMCVASSTGTGWKWC